MTSQSIQASDAPPAPPRGWSAPTAMRLAALSPFAILLALLVGTTFFDPMFAKPPDLLGMPLGVVVGLLTIVWAALGALVVWKARSPSVAALGLLVFTAVAIFAIVFGPALILIAQNLS